MVAKPTTGPLVFGWTSTARPLVTDRQGRIIAVFGSGATGIDEDEANAKLFTRALALENALRVLLSSTTAFAANVRNDKPGVKGQAQNVDQWQGVVMARAALEA